MRTRSFLSIAVLCLTFNAMAQENSSGPSTLKLDTATARPRAMEDLTRTAIARDYDRAWQSLAEAYNSGSASALDAYFVGSARTDVGGAIESQRKLGLQTRYTPQEHSLKAVFYAPEGDLVELQDTVRCQLHVLDGKKTIEDQPVVLHYVVLMTPAADRWVIRQMQAVPHF
jgi:hypothetical protein